MGHPCTTMRPFNMPCPSPRSLLPLTLPPRRHGPQGKVCKSTPTTVQSPPREAPRHPWPCLPLRRGAPRGKGCAWAQSVAPPGAENTPPALISGGGAAVSVHGRGDRAVWQSKRVLMADATCVVAVGRRCRAVRSHTDPLESGVGLRISTCVTLWQRPAAGGAEYCVMDSVIGEVVGIGAGGHLPPHVGSVAPFVSERAIDRLLDAAVLAGRLGTLGQTPPALDFRLQWGRQSPEL